MPLDSTIHPFPLPAEQAQAPAKRSTALTPAEERLAKDKEFRREHQARRAPKGRRMFYGMEDIEL